ncbi:antibiotic biosynthesis monooxygenase [Luteolibacter arcticus]|uniref:Antibiotic biosynthesis monooxygenase n=1 Tax=Luteolibacter arcticus TaxID=1581411 RepID=A0ABT3GQZ1_9BACT|nr:putative quinol monooxygenase [Luteolibacter arcticus]MCW1925878.1 antibiotic biosynthesis monooxygenase [Luteolibacter arcticus]
MAKQLIVKWKIKEQEIPRVLAMLPELAEKTRNEEGNLSYVIYQNESDPGQLVLHERYADADAVEAHRKSDHYQRIVAAGIIPHLESREVIAVKVLL